MIEEIRALMPLLEQISSGAIWAFAIYMLVKVIGVIIWPIVFVALAIIARPLVAKALAPKAPQKEEIDLYRLTHEGRVVGGYIGERSVLIDFFNALVQDGRYDYVYTNDLRDATAKIRGA